MIPIPPSIPLVDPAPKLSPALAPTRLFADETVPLAVVVPFTKVTAPAAAGAPAAVPVQNGLATTTLPLANARIPPARVPCAEKPSAPIPPLDPPPTWSPCFVPTMLFDVDTAPTIPVAGAMVMAPTAFVAPFAQFGLAMAYPPFASATTPPPPTRSLNCEPTRLLAALIVCNPSATVSPVVPLMSVTAPAKLAVHEAPVHPLSQKGLTTT